MGAVNAITSLASDVCAEKRDAALALECVGEQGTGGLTSNWSGSVADGLSVADDWLRTHCQVPPLGVWRLREQWEETRPAQLPATDWAAAGPPPPSQLAAGPPPAGSAV